MYTTCLYCNGRLGTNEAVPSLSIGRRVAFDARRGRVWVICGECGRWNLSPLDERWEIIEECERLFRGTPLRASTDNIGLAQLHDGVQLVRIGRALRPEIAAWRYGRYLRRWLPAQGGALVARAMGTALFAATGAVDATLHALGIRHSYDPITWLRITAQRQRVLHVAFEPPGPPAVLRFGHLDSAELIRPERGEPWRLEVGHDSGVLMLSGDAGLRVAGKLLAALNGPGASPAQVRHAMAKVEDAGNPDGYFARVAALAMRTSWGKHPDAVEPDPPLIRLSSDTERMALHITNRSFWGRGAVGSEPRTALRHLPLVDRIALEMAANEDAERRALEGELAELASAWREAEEIAAIADGLFFQPAARVARAYAAARAAMSRSSSAISRSVLLPRSRAYQRLTSR